MSNNPQHSGPAEPPAQVTENQRGNWLTVPATDPVVEYVTDTLWDYPERPTSWEVARLSQAAYIYRETSVGWAVVAKFYAVKAGSSAAKHASHELDRIRQIQSENIPRGEARAIEPLGLWRGVLFLECVDGLTLEVALDLQPEHLSLYALSVEEGTRLARDSLRQPLPSTDEDCSATMYELAEDRLAQAGFFHCEVSSWAKMDGCLRAMDGRWWPGLHAPHDKPAQSEEISRHVCRRNLTCWRNQLWLGPGASAHSWMKSRALSPALGNVPGTPRGSSKDLGHAALDSSRGQRWANARHPRDYIADHSPVNPQVPPRHNLEKIDRRLEMGETMMLGLRLAEGVRAERFEERFREPLVNVFGDDLKELRDLGLLTWDGSVTRLTRRGRLLGSRVFSRFV